MDQSPPNVATTVREFVESTLLFGDSSSVADDESLLGSGVLDSTGVIEVISFLESEFGISFDDSELVADNFDSISRITATVARKTA